jgi:ectoine hydroxylase-related dioxygenase (phytanoyl-CoA dioxygenase family)
MRPLPDVRYEIEVLDEQVEAFHRDGFTSIGRITTDEELDWLRGLFDALFAERALPLDDVDTTNGCMCFLPGTHLGDVLPHRHIDDDPSVHGLVTDHADPSGMVAVPLRAGGATFHHPRTLHHTPPNATDRYRRAVAVEHQTPPTPRATRAVRPWVDEGKAAWDARAPFTSA